MYNYSLDIFGIHILIILIIFIIIKYKIIFYAWLLALLTNHDFDRYPHKSVRPCAIALFAHPSQTAMLILKENLIFKSYIIIIYIVTYYIHNITHVQGLGFDSQVFQLVPYSNFGPFS